MKSGVESLDLRFAEVGVDGDDGLCTEDDRMDWRRLGEDRGLRSGYPNEELGISIFSVLVGISSINIVVLGLERILSMITGVCG